MSGSFRAPGGRFLISTGTATQALWVSASQLTYVDDAMQSLVLADLQLGTTVQVTKRTRLFDLRAYMTFGNASWWDYDVSHDGREFLFVRPDRVLDAVEPVVVLTWGEEIKRRTKEQGGR